MAHGRAFTALAMGLFPLGLLLVFHFSTLFGIHPSDDPFPFGLLTRLLIIAGSLIGVSAFTGALWPGDAWRIGAVCAAPLLGAGVPLGVFAAVEASHLVIVFALAVVFLGCAAFGGWLGAWLRRRVSPMDPDAA